MPVNALESSQVPLAAADRLGWVKRGLEGSTGAAGLD
jgi:hypothetical protein